MQINRFLLSICQSQPLSFRRRQHRPISLLSLAFLLGLMAPSASLATQQHSSMGLQPTTTTTVPEIAAAQYRVRVFFPHYPEAADDFTYVVPVWRTTSNTGLARFAIAQLIAGPTSAEQQQGLTPVIRFGGTSNCGQDFAIAISNGTATLQFCRQVVSNGIGDDARIKSAIEATLTQFSTVHHAVILNPNGDCFGDQSGDNRCLTQR